MKSEIEQILKVASTLADKNHPATDQLYRIAQFLGAGQDFDPSQDSGGYNMQVQHQDQQSPQQPQQSGMHPGIESFVQTPTEQPTDDRIQHKLTCTVLSPKDFAEDALFKYIKEIQSTLPVEVFNFSWSKEMPKKSVAV